MHLPFKIGILKNTYHTQNFALYLHSREIRNLKTKCL